MTDFRALCARMADELDYYRQLLMDDRREVHALATEARTALAEPQPPADGEVGELVVLFQVGAECEGGARLTSGQCRRAADLLEQLAATGKPALQVEPSDEELLELMPQQMRDDLAAAARALAGFDPDNIKAASVFRIILNCHVADHARAVLARWGTSNLAQTRSSLEPIPVAERLPEPGDCDAEGRCWWWYPPVPEQTYGYWLHEDDATERALDEWPTHWLPFNALPLPSGDESTRGKSDV